jgi:predicted DNA-binding transcriptional regulator AlpA
VQSNSQSDLIQCTVDDGMWTAKELEGLLKIDIKTIYGYVQRGLIPYVRVQSNVRFPKSAIRLWLKQNTFMPRSIGRL